LEKMPAPYVAVPTTAGTGAEVTRNAVLESPEHGVKVSMRSPLMLPRWAIVDPELTYSMPPDITASTGLDAITQLIEAYISSKANPLTDGLCCEGLRRAARSIRVAYEDGNNRKAREDMCIASLFSGIALANAKLGAVHGFAGPMGGMFDAPHGVICARLLPYVMEANVLGLCKNDKKHPILLKYNNLSRIITEKASANVEDGIEFIINLCNELKFNELSEFGVMEEHFSSIADKAERASSMKGNPINLNREELIGILRKAVR